MLKVKVITSYDSPNQFEKNIQKWLDEHPEARIFKALQSLSDKPCLAYITIFYEEGGVEEPKQEGGYRYFYTHS